MERFGTANRRWWHLEHRTAMFKGMQIYHNFIRPHEGLHGDTPADRAGIKVEGPNKWITIIQNATHPHPVNKERSNPRES